jgi:uncharacterized protein
MIRIQGRVPTPEASRWLQRLCFHFSKKIAVSYDEQRGEAQFPWGLCRLTADGGLLSFDCESATEAELARVQYAIDEHVKLFSRKAPLAVSWDEAVTSG